MRVYYVYIPRCFDGTFYVGMTNDIERRVNEHHYGIDRDCYTYERRPLRVVHVSEFRWVDQAIAAERSG
ncbi:MAG: GIY-YIG nuclease family protein [Candidatus Aquilonibacter sp.]